MQFDYVRVFQCLKNHDFPLDSVNVACLYHFWFFDNLDGYSSLRLHVLTESHCAECAFTQGLAQLVFSYLLRSWLNLWIILRWSNFTDWSEFLLGSRSEEVLRQRNWSVSVWCRKEVASRNSHARLRLIELDAVLHPAVGLLHFVRDELLHRL